jgi:hypothetical protein
MKEISFSSFIEELKKITTLVDQNSQLWEPKPGTLRKQTRIGIKIKMTRQKVILIATVRVSSKQVT